jgi:hypothetical protein
MKLWKHPAPVIPAPLEPEPPVELLPTEPPLQLRNGTKYCSSRGCSEETGLDCDYIDRRDRACPTAWCPQHRLVSHDHVYCPSHGRLIDGTSNDFGEHAHVDLDNPVPNLASWVAQELEEDITGMMQRLCADYHEELVIDPVRFVLVGVERVRTWERAWKMVSPLGVSLRVTLAIDELDPSEVHGRVNSKPVLTLPTPYHPDHGLGVELDSTSEMERQIVEFRRRMFLALARRAEGWHVAEPPPDEGGESHPEGSLNEDGSWTAPASPVLTPESTTGWSTRQSTGWKGGHTEELPPSA